MTGQSSDRRRHLRANISEISGTLHSPGDVEVLDLSLSGMAIEAATELEKGDRCFLELRHHGHSVSLEVEVRWASVLRVERLRDTFMPVFRAGVAFLEVLPDREAGLFEWLVVDPIADPGASPLPS